LNEQEREKKSFRLKYKKSNKGSVRNVKTSWLGGLWKLFLVFKQKKREGKIFEKSIYYLG